MAPGAARRFPGWLLLVLAVALAVIVYRPWHARAFDILDFSEFLPILKAAHDPLHRFTALVDYYATQHGRFNVLSYAALAAKWSWLGPNPLLWQLLRAGELVAIAALVYLLLRRLAAGPAGASLGASLFLFSYSAGLTWVRLTMGEPLGLLCALFAALIATSSRRPKYGWLQLLGAGLAIAAAILAKEMLIVWVPVLLLVVLYRSDSGKLDGWRFDSRARALVVTLCAGTALAALLVIRAARGGAAGGYAATYGAVSISPSRFGELFQRQFLPWPITGRADGVVMFAAVLLFLGVILLGLRAALRHPDTRKHAVVVVVLGLMLPAAGAVVYLPWPVYSPFYGFPFLFGPALLLSTAVTALGSSRLAVVATIAVIVLTIPQAMRLARTAETRQEVMTEVAAALVADSAAKRIVVAVPVLPAQAWQGLAPTLTRYAAASGGVRFTGAIGDLPCQAAAGLLQQRAPGTVLITFSDSCGVVPGATRVIVQRFRFWHWEPPGLGVDSLRADLIRLPTEPR